MVTEMIMPKVDMDQETGTVVEWIKTNGQKVEQGEIILVIETDKIAIDVEAPGTGTLDGISAHPGDEIPIGTVIAYILEEGEELPERPTEVLPSKEVSHPKAEAPPQPTPPTVSATPVAQKMAQDHGLDLRSIPTTGAKITKSDVERFLKTEAPSPPGEVIASPAARRKARIAGINLDLVKGTGPGGRIQGYDVEGYLSSQPAVGFPGASMVSAGESIPLIGMRRTIAERLMTSYQNIPHIQFTTRVEMTNFIHTRNDYNELGLKRGDEKVSVTALLVKLVAMVLADHRMLNSSFGDDKILLHQDINIGIAVALDEGLIVPVLKNADQKGISQIARESTDLVSRARNGNLTTSDVKDATFTISNLGPFCVEQFTAIINPPEAGILAVGATTSEVVALPDGAIAVRPVMRLTLSADHRIVDGAVAARFINDLKVTLENPVLKD
jgi:pyruvate dehydrogenase E2 component (dihydrolipoamide acetyltransferase)